MTEAANPCKCVTSQGTCSCTNYVNSSGRQGFWPVCAGDGCGHTAQIHGIVVSAANFKVEDKPKVSAPRPVSEPVEASKSIANAPGTVFTPAMMRAWLVANKVPNVGVRGRLRPEHIALAQAGLSK